MERSSSDITNTMMPVHQLELKDRVNTNQIPPTSQNLQTPYLPSHMKLDTPDGASKMGITGTLKLDHESSMEHSQVPRFLK